jgi:chromosome segregation ATPase
MKIDTSTINGYAEMSAEDKLKALEAYEFEAPAQKDDGEVTRLKAALSKANSEASDWKKQLREKQTEQERAEAERAESDKAIQEELKALRRDKTVSGYVAQCLALGYDKDLASKAAEAMADGNAAVIFECQQTFLETQKKAYEAAALNKQPSLTAGAPPTASKPEADNKLRAYFGLPPVKTH